MLFRLQIGLVLALAAILFGARSEAVRGLSASHSGTTHYVQECALVSLDIIDSGTSCLPDLARKIVQPIPLLVVALLALVFVIRPNPSYFLRRDHFSITRPLLHWGLAAGVISLPPDAYNKKEPYNDTASA
jgi:hypothetical protein